MEIGAGTAVSDNAMARKFRGLIPILLILLISFLEIQSPTLKAQDLSWIKVGDFAEYEASGVTWLLVKNRLQKRVNWFETMNHV